MLIGGTSHCGKSTLADAIGQRLNLRVIGTDQLARHPGRPWPAGGKPVREHVAAYYAAHAALNDADELVNDVLRHYHRQRPHVCTIIRYQLGLAVDQSAQTQLLAGLCLEGSCLWPSSYQPLGVPAVWLTIAEQSLRHRIRINSQFDSLSTAQQALVTVFTERSLAFQRRMVSDAIACGAALLDAESPDMVDDAIAIFQSGTSHVR